MKEKESQRVRLTKRLIKESLLKLLEHKDIRNITVKELCEDAELNRTTFYLHYENPDDVLRSIHVDIIDNINSHFEKITSKNARAVIMDILEYIHDNKKTFNVLLCKQSSDEFRMQFIQSVFPYDIFSPDDSEKDGIQKYLNGFIAAGLFSIVYNYIADDCKEDVEKITDIIINITSATLKIKIS